MFVKLKTLTLSAFFVILIAHPVFPQDEKNSEKTKQEALMLFDQGNYKDALVLYKQLISKFPKDGLFHYYAGLCLYYQNARLNDAIEYLDYASGKPMVPDDVFYFLGMAYRKYYQFYESSSAFHKYSSIASRIDVKDKIPVREAEMSKNATSITLEYNPFEIITSSLIDIHDSVTMSQIKAKGGSITKKTSPLFTINENEEELSTYVFMPKQIRKGDYIYFSAYGRSKKNGLDIFRIKKNAGKMWSDPEAIKSINTDFDEIMPYFDPISNDLYFASKGYNSMGGYDVFKSHYDPQTDIWTEPINLGFPINSPMNEFVAIPGYDLGNILVITDRQGLGNLCTVYKLKISEPKKSLASASREEIARIGNLGGISTLPALAEVKEEMIVKNKEKQSVNIKAADNVNTTHENSSDNSLKTALGFQHKSDSLLRLAKATRVHVKTLPNPNDRWAYQSQILEWEKLAKEYQEKADGLYALITEGEKTDSNPPPSTIIEAKEINGIKVFEYSEEIAAKESENPKDKISKTDPGLTVKNAFQTSDEPGEVVKTPEKDIKSDNRFDILQNSPYNISHPFPIDVKLPDGAFYRIQLGVFSQNVDFNSFGGITPITGERIPEKNLIKYYAGKFSNYQEARIALEKVKQNGYSDAYIVGWYNGEKMALNRVLEFENRDSVNMTN